MPAAVALSDLSEPLPPWLLSDLSLLSEPLSESSESEGSSVPFELSLSDSSSVSGQPLPESLSSSCFGGLQYWWPPGSFGPWWPWPWPWPFWEPLCPVPFFGSDGRCEPLLCARPPRCR